MQSSSRLQSPPLTGPASPPLLTPASPPPLQPQFPTQSRQGEARQSRPLPPSPNQSRRGRTQPTRPASPSQTRSQRVRAQQSVPPPPSQPRSRRGRAQPSRPAGEESRDEWSSEPSDITVQPFMMDVGPTFQLSSVLSLTCTLWSLDTRCTSVAHIANDGASTVAPSLRGAGLDFLAKPAKLPQRL